MRPLRFTLPIALAAACNQGSGPTTDTDASTGETTIPGTTTGASADVPTTGAPADTQGGATTQGTTTGTTAPIGDTTTAAPDTSGTTLADDTTSGSTSSASTTESDTTTGPGESALQIAIVDAELYADCQPRVEPDPVGGTWYVSFDNFDGAAETAATLVSASLSLADADPPVIEPISVTPKDSPAIPAGEQVDQKMAKLQGDMHSACDHCDEFYELVLTYDENGTIHEAVEDVTISCAF